MSAKNMDSHSRWRSRTVSFRMSPEEDEQLETLVKLSGLTKQDYIIRRLLGRDVVVQGNIRAFKYLRNQMNEILIQLRRIEAGHTDEDLLDTIRFVAAILDKTETE